MANQNETRNLILKQVQLWWPKLTRPTAPFGEDIYDLQLRVPAKRKAELEAIGKTRTVDDAPGMVVLNVRKKALKSDGSPSRKPIVVNGHRDPLDPDTIGNGSVGNVRLRLNDYQIVHPKTGKVTKEGTKAVLEAVQVTKHIVFVSQGGGDMNDFEDEDFEQIENEEAATAPAKKSKPAAKKPAADEDDDGFGGDDDGDADQDADDGDTDLDPDEEPEETPKKGAALAKWRAEQAALKAAAAKKSSKPVAKSAPAKTTTMKTAAKGKPVQRRNADY
jgi:hypothetical protein